MTSSDEGARLGSFGKVRSRRHFFNVRLTPTFVTRTPGHLGNFLGQLITVHLGVPMRPTPPTRIWERPSLEKDRAQSSFVGAGILELKPQKWWLVACISVSRIGFAKSVLFFKPLVVQIAMLCRNRHSFAQVGPGRLPSSREIFHAEGVQSLPYISSSSGRCGV